MPYDLEIIQNSVHFYVKYSIFENCCILIWQYTLWVCLKNENDFITKILESKLTANDHIICNMHGPSELGGQRVFFSKLV